MGTPGGFQLVPQGGRDTGGALEEERGLGGEDRGALDDLVDVLGGQAGTPGEVGLRDAECFQLFFEGLAGRLGGVGRVDEVRGGRRGHGWCLSEVGEAGW